MCGQRWNKERKKLFFVFHLTLYYEYKFKNNFSKHYPFKVIKEKTVFIKAENPGCQGVTPQLYKCNRKLHSRDVFGHMKPCQKLFFKKRGKVPLVKGFSNLISALDLKIDKMDFLFYATT